MTVPAVACLCAKSQPLLRASTIQAGDLEHERHVNGYGLLGAMSELFLLVFRTSSTANMQRQQTPLKVLAMRRKFVPSQAGYSSLLINHSAITICRVPIAFSRSQRRSSCRGVRQVISTLFILGPAQIVEVFVDDQSMLSSQQSRRAGSQNL